MTPEEGEEHFVRNVFIKFPTEEDTVLACAELVQHSPVSRLSNGVFCIPWSSLTLLEACAVRYAFASEDDLANAQQIWNFDAPRSHGPAVP